MDNDLIAVYARGNLLEALFAVLFADIIAKDSNWEQALQKFQSDVRYYLLQIGKWPDCPDAAVIQEHCGALLQNFFHLVEKTLEDRGVRKREA